MGASCVFRPNVGIVDFQFPVLDRAHVEFVAQGNVVAGMKRVARFGVRTIRIRVQIVCMKHFAGKWEFVGTVAVLIAVVECMEDVGAEVAVGKGDNEEAQEYG